ncbi:MAG: transposase, partial [Anaerolineae bacterium]|nr:transposase [Anaerolineae bacterium]
MFRKNDQHLQWPLFSSIDSLPKKQQVRLEASWAGTFYHELFCRIDEEPFADVYSDEDSRPNIPVNVLVGFETLKAGYGWSDEEAYDHFCFDVQVRYALGCRDLSEGHFELRTVYNFRQRVAQHMQETGENLIERAFEQVTDDQIAAFDLKTNKLRMDSTLIASNIRQTTRLQLLVEVLQRVHRMLDESDQQQYADDFAAYLKGSSGQYIYSIKREKYAEHLQRAGELMHKLVAELQAKYVDEPTYQVLDRVFKEHFVSAENTLRAKKGKELSADSLQSPDDWEATYRQKRGQDHIGYVTNVTETCHPENPFQLIVKVQTESNNTDDAAMLAETLPSLKERTGVNEMHTDGGYNSPEADEAMQEQQVQQIQTAIRGRQPAEEKLGLEDFTWQTNADDGQPQSVTCPHGQQAESAAGRKEGRYRAAFDSSGCESCPLRDQCPTEPLKRRPENVLRFSQQDVNVALRRQRCADERASKQHLRPAVEATVRAVKHPFGNGKVPVRGKPRVGMLMIGTSAMNNVRQIYRYQRSQKETGRAEKRSQKAAESAQRQPVFSFFASLWTQLRACLRLG